MVKLYDPQAAQYALLAAFAESMLDQTTLTPPLDPRAAPAWQLLAHFTALNALFGQQAVGLGERVYYGFLAQSLTDRNAYVAVIRGTELAIEWIENTEGFLVDGPPVGQVEQGFYSIYESLRFVGMSPVTGMLAAQALANYLPDGAVLTIVGHSLGSAIATYLMADVARIPDRKFTVKGALFASPRTGDRVYVSCVDGLVGPGNYRVYNSIRDIVAHVPPSLPLGLGFQSLPQVTWITPLTAQAVIQNTPYCNHSAYSYAAELDSAAVSPQGCISALPLSGV